MTVKKSIRSLVLLLIVLPVICFSALHAFADTMNAEVTGTFHQTTARSMLSLINEFRTTGTPWYWNENNTSKTYPTGLKSLSYDFKLEQIAMQRAAEVSVSFDHIRPDNRQPWTAYEEKGYPTNTYKGENIAVNYQNTAQALFDQWKEDDEDYSGQGHRRSMLNGNFTHVGIAIFQVGRYYYAVQEFGSVSSDMDAPAAANSETIMQVKVNDGYIASSSFSCDTSAVTMEVGTSMTANSASVDLTTKGWGYPGTEIVIKSDVPVTYTSSNSTGLSISGKTMTAKNAGTYTVTANASYNGTNYSKTFSVTVKKRSLKNSSVTASLDQTSYTYDGTAKTPTATVKYGSTVLKQNTDYTLSYSANINAGNVTVTVTGKGNYEESITRTFRIDPKDISKLTVSQPSDLTYSGAQLKPAVTVQDGTKVLTSGTDYTVAYGANKNVGEGTVTVNCTGNYTGKIVLTFGIQPKDISELDITEPYSMKYTGGELTPDAVIKYGSITLVNGTDYELDYEDNISVGRASVTAKGKGNYAGEALFGFTIASIGIEDCDISADATGFVYDGKAHQPEVKLSYKGEVIDADEYVAAVKENESISAGRYTLVISGTGSYAGSAEIAFEILPFDIKNCDIALSETEFTYDGMSHVPDALLSRDGKALPEDAFTVSEADTVNAGEHAMVITGKGNYTGKISAGFTILPAQVTDVDISLEYTETEETGRPLEPAVTVSMGGYIFGEDEYTVEYTDNVLPGEAKVTVTFSGNYTGSAETGFEITEYLIYEPIIYDIDIVIVSGRGENSELPEAEVRIYDSKGEEVEVTADGNKFAAKLYDDSFRAVVSKAGYTTRECDFSPNQFKTFTFEIHRKGDINGDGKVNAADITKAAAHIKGLKAIRDSYDFAVGDVNEDSKLNAVDITKIAAHIKGIKVL